jgi:hypothetical protein
VAERAPLVQQGRLQVQPIKEFNPRWVARTRSGMTWPQLHQFGWLLQLYGDAASVCCQIKLSNRFPFQGTPAEGCRQHSLPSPHLSHMHNLQPCRFEEDGFSLGRDYDPDRVRAEQRKLKRQLQKERRGEGMRAGSVSGQAGWALDRRGACWAEKPPLKSALRQSVGQQPRRCQHFRHC